MHNTIVPMEQRNLSIFAGGAAANNTVGGDYTYYTWTKPADAAFVWMMIISSGGAGGNGAVGTSAAVRLGGYGGGQSPVFTGLYPSYMVPDILYVKVACENFTTTSVVNTFYTGVYVDSNCTFAFAHTLGGACTNASAPGSPGLAPVAGASNTGYQHSGVYSNTVPGTPAATNASVELSVTGYGSRGGGAGLAGSGTSSPGDNLPPNYANSAFIPTILAGTSPAAANTNGNDGIFSMKPFFSTGGAGGYGYSNAYSAVTNLVSGYGGKGGFGSGGGGGGAGINSRPNPRGGSGGPGIIIIKTV